MLDSTTTSVNLTIPNADTTEAIAGWGIYANADITQESGSHTLWCRMRAHPRPSFTRPLLKELLALQEGIQLRCSLEYTGAAVRSVVLASNIPGIFNLGGDLDHFANCIETQDAEALRLYAYDCIRVLFNNANGYAAGVETIGLVQGMALGGGFEAAMSCSLIFAERSAVFGLPEASFNLFPGMGAHSFLSRRLGSARAERFILEAKLHTAEVMMDLGLVDVLVEDGEGEEAVRAHIERRFPKSNALSAIANIRQRLSAPSWTELSLIADIWVNTAMRIGTQDLRRMRLLTHHQNKKMQKAAA